ncbi:MAG: alpha/beta hydrolase [Aggregatilineales bacterium]
MKSTTHLLTLPGRSLLAAICWQPDTGQERAVIVLAHGYGEHFGRYIHVAEYLTQQGYLVYAFDHRGHGETHRHQAARTPLGYYDQFRVLVDDLNAVIQQTHAEHVNQPLFLFGHSMGGLIAAYATILDSSLLRGLILSAPAIAASADVPVVQKLIGRTLSRIAPQAGAVPRISSSMLSRDPDVGRAYDADPKVAHTKMTARVGVEMVNASDYVLDNADKISLPILIMHGSSDRIVNPKSSQMLYDRVHSADKTLKIYEGFYHESLNEIGKERVLADLASWLANH